MPVKVPRSCVLKFHWTHLVEPYITGASYLQSAYREGEGGNKATNPPLPAHTLKVHRKSIEREVAVAHFNETRAICASHNLILPGGCASCPRSMPIPREPSKQIQAAHLLDILGISTTCVLDFDSHGRSVMDSATELPASLVRQMNSAASITTLNTYRTGVGKDALGGALSIEAQYDRQSARFVSRLPSAYVLRFLPCQYHGRPTTKG